MCPWEPTCNPGPENSGTHFVLIMQQNQVGQTERNAKDPWFFKQVQEKKKVRFAGDQGSARRICLVADGGMSRHEAEQEPIPPRTLNPSMKDLKG